MEAKFIVVDNFQVGAGVNKSGNQLIISESSVQERMKLGKHPKTGKWIDGVLNHCEPADDFTAGLLGEELKAKEGSEEEVADAIGAIKKEMDEMGAAYDRRWKLDRLKIELVKAKKERGL